MQEMKSILWKKLYKLSLNMSKPWLLAKDFNDIHDPYEKKRGAPFNWHRANIFNDKIVPDIVI